MKFQFKDLTERDMDLLFLEEFASSKEFCRLFLDKIGVTEDFEVVSIEHSKMDYEFGESDMVVIFETRSEKRALLIEDKIDAIAMPNQSGRYKRRGDKGVRKHEFDRYDIFMVAPQDYIDANLEAKKYPHHVSYEEIYSYFQGIEDARSEYKIQQIEQAIDKEKKGYRVAENNRVTTFTQKYSKLLQKHFPEITKRSSDESKGDKAYWPTFVSGLKHVDFTHKSNKARVELGFLRMAKHFDEFSNYIHDLLGDEEENGYTLNIRGGSAAITIYVPILDFKDTFAKQKQDVMRCGKAIKKLTEFAQRISQEKIDAIRNK